MKRRQRHGNSMVEFALAAPMIVLLLMGAIRFSFLLYGGISVANAARTAAMRSSFGEASATNQKASCDIARAHWRGILGWGGASIPRWNGRPLPVTSVVWDPVVPGAGAE